MIYQGVTRKGVLRPHVTKKVQYQVQQSAKIRKKVVSDGQQKKYGAKKNNFPYMEHPSKNGAL